MDDFYGSEPSANAAAPAAQPQPTPKHVVVKDSLWRDEPGGSPFMSDSEGEVCLFVCLFTFFSSVCVGGWVGGGGGGGGGGGVGGLWGGGGGGKGGVDIEFY